MGGCPRKRLTGSLVGALQAAGSAVSQEQRRPKHSKHTLGTLFGHSRALGPEGPQRHPRETLPWTPPTFGDTLRDTPGTLRARKTPVAGHGFATFAMIWWEFRARKKKNLAPPPHHRHSPSALPPPTPPPRKTTPSPSLYF